MKRIYSFFAMLMCMLFTFQANARLVDSKVAVLIKGNFVEASVQYMNGGDEYADINYTVTGAADGTYKVLSFDSKEVGNEFNISATAKKGDAYVYVNGVETEQGVVELKDGDVVKIYSEKPSVTKMNIGFMQPLQEKGIADKQVEVVMDKVTPVSVNELNKVFEVLCGTEFQIKAKDGYKIAGVSYCNEDVEAVDGVYTVVADREGDALAIIDMNEGENSAVANIKGTFYTFSAQDVNIADPREAEVFSFTPGGEAIEKTVEVKFDGEKTVRLVGQAPENAFFVTLDGKKVVSESADYFEAEVTLKDGSVLNVANASEYNATINLDGVFYTFAVQDTNESGKAAELFSVVPAGEEANVTKTIELVSEEIEVRLIGQAPENAFFVTLDGKKVVSTSADNFDAVVTLKNGSVLNVANASKYNATVSIDGTFYTFAVQATAESGKAAELFSVVPAGEEANVTKTIELVSEEVEVRLVGQAPENAFFVTLDGKKVVSTSAEMFDAVVTLKNGSVLNVANASKYNATISLDGTFYTFAVQATAESGKAAELFSVVPGGEEINETKKIELAAEEVEVRLIGQAPENAFYVTLDGKKVASTSKDNFEAVVTLKDGSKLSVANASEYNAAINLNGAFYTFSVQAVDAADPRAAELYSVVPGGEEIDVTETIELDAEEVVVRLVGQAPDNAMFVTLNGKLVASEQAEMFEAVVTLKNGSVLNVTDVAPACAKISLRGAFYTFSVQAVDAADPRTAELFSVTPDGEETSATETICLNGDELKVRLVGQAENNAIFVTVNGIPVASNQADMFEAVVTLKDGDVISVTNDDPVKGKATAVICGTFFTFTAQDVNIEDPKKAEVFSIGGEVDGKVTIPVYGENRTIRLVGQAEDNAIYVTLNGQEVVSDNDYMFDAVVVIADGDVLSITNSNPTGINAVNTAIENGKVYNLQGVQVKALQSGLYIMNGKKVLVK